MAVVISKAKTSSKSYQGSFSDIINMKISVHEGYVHIVSEIRSHSRPGLVHIAQVYVAPGKGVVKYSCDCEGFTFKKKCWHTQLLLSLVSQ